MDNLAAWLSSVVCTLNRAEESCFVSTELSFDNLSGYGPSPTDAEWFDIHLSGVRLGATGA